MSLWKQVLLLILKGNEEPRQNDCRVISKIIYAFISSLLRQMPVNHATRSKIICK